MRSAGADYLPLALVFRAVSMPFSRRNCADTLTRGDGHAISANVIIRRESHRRLITRLHHQAPAMPRRPHAARRQHYVSASAEEK